ncbi:MAG: hypothetical protein GF344_10960, partial [Chitinivibrionales bacterium]|nr:hypothetical protein [Chitinivibrionales bacterium]MBD3357323.1 hypothetical protein [Chitinivibrionales bacterium]
MKIDKLHALLVVISPRPTPTGQTNRIPHSSVPIVGETLLHHQIVYLRNQGITKLTLLTNSPPRMVEKSLSFAAEIGMKPRWFRLAEPCGISEALRSVLPLVYDELFVVLSGNTLFPCDLSILTKLHHAQRASATIALKFLAETSRYRTMVIDSHRRVTA